MNKYKYKEDVKGIIINIKHGASKEGPGWRSIVYFKGCNFYCPWCGSPESIPLNPRTHYYYYLLLEIDFSDRSLLYCNKSITS